MPRDHSDQPNSRAPRRRRLLRTFLWSCAALIVVGIGIVAYVVIDTVRITSGPPGPIEDIADDLRILARKRPDFISTGINGWSDVSAALDLYNLRFDTRYGELLTEAAKAVEAAKAASPDGSVPYDYEGIDAFDMAVHDAFDSDVYAAIVQATKARRFDARHLLFPLQSPAPIAVFHRGLTVMDPFAARLETLTNEERWDELADHFDTLVQLSNVFRLQPGFQSTSWGDYCLDTGLHALLRTLPENGVPEATALAMLQSLQSVHPAHPHIMLDEDAAIHHAFFDAFYTPEGFERPYDAIMKPGASSRQTLRGAFRSRWVKRNRDALHARIDALVEDGRSLIGVPYPDRNRAPLSDADAGRIMGQAILNGYVEESAEGWVENRLPNFFRGGLDGLDQAAATRGAFALRLMICLHTERHGEAPATLDELRPIAASIGIQIPTDPLAGTSFGYERTDPSANTHNASYRLFSLGPDGIVDGPAATAPMNDVPNVRYRSPGTDFGFYPADKPDY